VEVVTDPGREKVSDLPRNLAHYEKLRESERHIPELLRMVPGGVTARGNGGWLISAAAERHPKDKLLRDDGRSVTIRFPPALFWDFRHLMKDIERLKVWRPRASLWVPTQSTAIVNVMTKSARPQGILPRPGPLNATWAPGIRLAIGSVPSCEFMHSLTRDAMKLAEARRQTILAHDSGGFRTDCCHTAAQFLRCRRCV